VAYRGDGGGLGEEATPSVAGRFLAAERRLLGERAYLREYELAIGNLFLLPWCRDAHLDRMDEVPVP
jgi:hypothetical protein